MNIPLFPLQTVLFPGGPLSLRIFERRYLDMISECLRSNQLFGIVLNNQLPNSDENFFCNMGTLAQIVDWDQGIDGVLGLKVIGNDRFLLANYDQDENGLNIGEVQVIESEKKLLLPEEYMTLSSILKSILDEFSELYASVKKDFNDASWVGYRLAEILPIELSQKQIYLEIEEPIDRLELLNTFMKANQEFLTLPKNSTLQ
ncbi:MAG: LON peptidase substrate-binding domain-containing protein [Woeseiaceae bacterium]